MNSTEGPVPGENAASGSKSPEGAQPSTRPERGGPAPMRSQEPGTGGEAAASGPAFGVQDMLKILQGESGGIPVAPPADQDSAGLPPIYGPQEPGAPVDQARPSEPDVPIEVAKRRAELDAMLGPNLTVPHITGIVKELGIPRDRIQDHLSQKGIDIDKISKVMESSDLPPELTEEDKANPTVIPTTEEEIDAGKASLEALDAQLDGMKPGEYTEELKAAMDATIQESKSKIHKILFDDEVGLLRKQDRFRRLFVQPAIMTLFAAVITYMILLNSVTKKAATRIGG